MLLYKYLNILFNMYLVTRKNYELHGT